MSGEIYNNIVNSRVTQNLVHTAKLGQKQFIDQSGGQKYTKFNELQKAGLTIDYTCNVVGINRVAEYKKNNIRVSSEIESKINALEAMREVCFELRNQAISYNPSNGGDLEPSLLANQAIRDISALLNSQNAGEFIFGGINSRKQPIDVNKMLQIDFTDENADSYSDAIKSDKRHEIYFSRTIGIEVSANEKVFEDLFTALGEFKKMKTNGSDMEKVVGLLDSSTSDLNKLKIRFDMLSQEVTDINSMLDSEETRLIEINENLFRLNVFEISAAIQEQTAKIQSMYVALNKLMKLSILDYFN